MIYLTQLIYLKEGGEQIFQEFEAVAIPLLDQYNGHLLARFRPSHDTWIAGEYPQPYEVHIVGFKTRPDFEAFAEDETRKNLLPLKEQSIERTILIEGTVI